MLETTEFPPINAMTQVATQQTKAIGINVDLQMMGWNGMNTACDRSNRAGWPSAHGRLAEVMPQAPGGQWYPPAVVGKNVGGILPTDFLAV